MPAISAKPTLASHSPVECGAFFSPSRSVRLRFLRVRRLFCGNPPAPRRMCAHFSARKIELRTSRPRFLRACRLFCGNLPAPLFECASAFSGNRRIGRLQPHFCPPATHFRISRPIFCILPPNSRSFNNLLAQKHRTSHLFRRLGRSNTSMFPSYCCTKPLLQPPFSVKITP